MSLGLSLCCFKSADANARHGFSLRSQINAALAEAPEGRLENEARCSDSVMQRYALVDRLLMAAGGGRLSPLPGQAQPPRRQHGRPSLTCRLVSKLCRVCRLWGSQEGGGRWRMNERRRIVCFALGGSQEWARSRDGRWGSTKHRPCRCSRPPLPVGDVTSGHGATLPPVGALETRGELFLEKGFSEWELVYRLCLHLIDLFI